MYFEFKYVKMICIGYIVLALYILLREKVKHRVLLVRALPIVPAALILLSVEMHLLSILNIMLIWILVFSSSVLTIVNVNSVFKVRNDTLV